MLDIIEYNLPDRILLSPNGEHLALLVWQPTETTVVIGNGSTPDIELHTANILADGVPVMRRDSGGCAVALTPDMLCVSVALYGKGDENTVGYFRQFNSIVISALDGLGIRGAHHAGMSDIAVGDKKIGGTAIYRNRDVVFYHAVLNLSADGTIFDRYLKMPPRMPDYRAGRSHRDFVSSLQDLGATVSFDDFKTAIELEWTSHSRSSGLPV